MFPGDTSMTFQEYYQRFKSGLQNDAYTELRPLAHGGLVAQINQSGPRLAVMSGLHGNERSGPMALLEWACQQNKPLCPDDQSLWLLPLLNDDGWNKNERHWQELDLNRVFLPETAGTPGFIQQVMAEWAHKPPEMFLDIHEDSSRPDEPYLFWYKNETHTLALQLAEYLQAKSEAWDDLEYWRGSGEVYLRTLGCTRCFTIEAPAGWPMQERIRWNLAAVEWCLKHLNDNLAD